MRSLRFICTEAPASLRAAPARAAGRVPPPTAPSPLPPLSCLRWSYQGMGVGEADISATVSRLMGSLGPYRVVAPEGSSRMEDTSASSRGMPATPATERRRLTVTAGAANTSAVVSPPMLSCAFTTAGAMGALEGEGVDVGVMEREAPTEGVVVGVWVGVRVAVAVADSDREGREERVVVCEGEMVAEAHAEGETLTLHDSLEVAEAENEAEVHAVPVCESEEVAEWLGEGEPLGLPQPLGEGEAEKEPLALPERVPRGALRLPRGEALMELEALVVRERSALTEGVG